MWRNGDDEGEVMRECVNNKGMQDRATYRFGQSPSPESNKGT